MDLGTKTDKKEQEDEHDGLTAMAEEPEEIRDKSNQNTPQGSKQGMVSYVYATQQNENNKKYI